MDAPTAPKPWKAEYAKSSRASCRSCSNLISKDTFRLAKMAPSTQFDGYMAVSTHHSRFFLSCQIGGIPSYLNWFSALCAWYSSLCFQWDPSKHFVGIDSTPFWGHQNSAEFWQMGFVIDVKGCVRLCGLVDFFKPSRFVEFGLLAKISLTYNAGHSSCTM